MGFLRRLYKRDELPLTSMSDEALFSLLVESGNKEAVGELFSRYTHLVLGVCMNYLKDSESARDASMQIFENILLKPPVKSVESFKNWLFVVSKNHCLMLIRKAKVEEKYISSEKADSLLEIMENDDTLHLFNEDEEAVSPEQLQNALNSLSNEQKICIEMFFLDGLSYKDITDKTGYELKHVKSYIQNGKRNLKILLENGNNRT